MKARLITLCIPIVGILILPLWLVASIILGQDAFDWIKERK